MKYNDWLLYFVNAYRKHNPILISKPEHYIIRCPYCGDSIKHLNKGHLYISKLKPVFYCVRCDTGGHIAKLLPKIKERFDESDYVYLISSINALPYDILNEYDTIEQTTNTKTTFTDYVIGHILKILEEHSFTRVWIKTINEIYTSYKEQIANTVKHVLFANNSHMTDDQISLLYDMQIPILTIDALHVLLHELPDIKRYIKHNYLFDATLVYIGFNGIQIRYSNQSKIRFRTIRFNEVPLQRFMTAWTDKHGFNLLQLYNDFKKAIIQLKYPSLQTRYQVHYVLAESVSDLITYQIRNKQFTQEYCQYVKTNEESSVQLYVPAFNKGILTAFNIASNILPLQSKNKIYSVDTITVLLDSDNLEIQLLKRLIAKKESNATIYVHLPIIAKDYRESLKTTILTL